MNSISVLWSVHFNGLSQNRRNDLSGASMEIMRKGTEIVRGFSGLEVLGQREASRGLRLGKVGFDCRLD